MQLINYGGRNEMDTKAVALSKVLGHIPLYHVEFGLTPPFEKTPELQDHLEAMKAIDGHAVKAITVIAGLVVDGMPNGKQKSEQASFIIQSAQSKIVPQALLDCLKKAV